MKIWSPRLKYKSTVAGREKSRDDTEAGNVMQGTRRVRSENTVVSGINIAVMNVCSLGSKLHYVIDHAVENKLDVVMLTETCSRGYAMLTTSLYGLPESKYLY